MRAVVVEDLVVRYGDVVAVDGTSFSVGAGQVYGLLGPNGAGKTSVLRVLTTLLRASSGKAWVMGHEVTADAAAVRRLIGYVPQSLSADGALTGRQNALLFARLYAAPRAERRERVEQALARMGLEGDADRPAQTYSGGMVRRLEIACALLASPRVLILDEPTVGLDPVARRDVWRHLGRLREDTGATVLVTTHSMEEAEEQCQRVAVLSNGRIRAEGSPAELRLALGRPGGTLEDVFVALTESDRRATKGDMREVGRRRRTARRLG
ncbi:MAG TPA: ATP-binding cassette domain-containing protein [Acidimicrobiales bacterium]|nr:ATP-binding cassette domain-containing protein [Acidimicrobiales bacterium]